MTAGEDTARGREPDVTLLARAALYAFLAGFGLALGVWLLFLPDLQSYSSNNVLAHRSVWRVLGGCAGVGVAFVVLPGLYWQRLRTRLATEQVHRLASVLLPLSLAFAVPPFFQLALWRGKETLFCSSVLLWGFTLERSLRVAFAAWPPTSLGADLKRLVPRLVNAAPHVVVGLLTVGFFYYMSYYTVLRHLQLETRAYDLGVYDNTFWNLLRGEWFYSSPCLGMRGSQIMYHATFTAYVLLPFYALYQRAESLLIIQAALCALAAVPLYGLVRRRLGSPWMGVAFVAAYFLYAPGHGSIFYDFHFLTISPFFVLTTLYFFETRAKLWLWVSLGLALANREDMGIGLAGAFLFYLISGERPWAALVGGIVSMAYVVFTKFWLMPLHATSQADSFIYAYEAFTTRDAPGYAGAIRTWFTNPYFLASHVLTEEKFAYSLVVLGPVLLLPLRNPRVWLFLILGAITTLLSFGYPPLLGTSFQYTAQWTAYIFAASAICISTWHAEPSFEARKAAATVAVLLVSIVMSHNFGAFARGNGFRGGFSTVSFEFSEAQRAELADLRAIAAQIPKSASVTVTERELPHLSNRHDCFTLRNEIRGHYGSDYVLLRVADCRQGSAKGVMTDVIQSREYGMVETRGPFQLWKKGADQSRNAEGAEALRIPLPAGG